MVASQHHPSDRDLELLSAYVDGELSDREAAALEQRLRHEPALSAALEDMRATIALLNKLPSLKAPRNFTLDPARFRRPAPWWSRLFTLTNVLQLSGALGTVVSVMLIIGALLLNGMVDQNAKTQDAAQPAGVQAPTNEPQVEESASPLLEEAAPSEMPQVALVPTEASAPAATPPMEAAPQDESTAIAYGGEGLIQTTIVAQSTLYFSTDTWRTSTAAALDDRPTAEPATGPPLEPGAGTAVNGTAEPPVIAAPPADAEAPAASDADGATDGAADFSDADTFDGVVPAQPNAESEAPAALQAAPGAAEIGDDATSSDDGSQAAGSVAATGDAMREPGETPITGSAEQKSPTSTPGPPTAMPTATPVPTTTQQRRLTRTPLPSPTPSPAEIAQLGPAVDAGEAESEPQERTEPAEEDDDSRWLVVVGIVSLCFSLAALVWGRLRVRRA